MDELLAVVGTEPSTGGPGFCFNVSVVPRCMNKLWPVLNLK